MGNTIHERTRFRIDMRENGYWPVLAHGKRPVGTGWQQVRPSEDEVLSWNRSTFRSTGLKLDGDLAVIDVDATEGKLVDALAEAMNERYPALFQDGLVRHAGKVKEAWIARVDEPFRRLASRQWTLEGAGAIHSVECFGSLTTRHFGVDGPHTYCNGAVVSSYAFAGSATPANTPRSLLPELPKAAYVEACTLFDKIAAAAGMTIVKKKNTEDMGDGRVVYDLTDAMVFESDRRRYRLGELKTAAIAAQHAGNDLRVRSSFLGHGRNPTKCIVGVSRSDCVFIYDFETGLMHMPAEERRDRQFQELMNAYLNMGADYGDDDDDDN